MNKHSPHWATHIKIQVWSTLNTKPTCLHIYLPSNNNKTSIFEKYLQSNCLSSTSDRLKLIWRQFERFWNIFIPDLFAEIYFTTTSCGDKVIFHIIPRQCRVNYDNVFNVHFTPYVCTFSESLFFKLSLSSVTVGIFLHSKQSCKIKSCASRTLFIFTSINIHFSRVFTTQQTNWFLQKKVHVRIL